MSKLPWFKFFPTDWRADVGLKLCSLSARGLWLEMICIMHEAGGYLEINGSSVSTPALAALSGTTPQEITELLGELEEAGVFSRDRKGRLYSRRMLRDLKKAGVAQKNGRRGGNPTLLKQRDNSRLDKPEGKSQDKWGLKTQKPETRVQTQKITPKGVNKKAENRAARLSADNPEDGHMLEDILFDPEVGELRPLLRESLDRNDESSEIFSSEPTDKTPTHKKRGNGPKNDQRGARLREDWEPTTDDICFARKRGLEDELLATEALKFRNYWTSLAGRKAVKVDWHRTWQNWILRGYEKGPGNSSKGGGTFGRGGTHGVQSGGQRPGGLDLAEIGARVLGRAQAQDDLSQERRQSFATGRGGFAKGHDD
ncbi:MAG: hypothetical protein V7776_12170 [Halopseudomonas aestusnigri]